MCRLTVRFTFGFVCGAWSDCTPFVIMFMSFLIWLIMVRKRGFFNQWKLLLPIFVQGFGYIFLSLSPAQRGRTTPKGLNDIFYNLINVLKEYYYEFKILIIICMFLFIVSVYVKVRLQYLTLAAIVFAGSLSIEFILPFTDSVPERVWSIPAVMLTVTICLLVTELDVRTNDTAKWPNDAIAKYYGIKAIIGIEKNKGNKIIV